MEWNQWTNNIFPNEFNYYTRSFTDIWPNLAAFQADYAAAALDLSDFGQSTDKQVSQLFYLLYAKYGNSHIRSNDEEQFKYKLWAIVFSYGPAWLKRLEIQEKVRALTENDLSDGGKAIYNTALNPDVAPSTQSLEELQYISNQNTTNYKRNKADSLNVQWGLLKTDVTTEFINRFANLFTQWAGGYPPLMFPAKEEENTNG